MKRIMMMACLMIEEDGDGSSVGASTPNPLDDLFERLELQSRATEQSGGNGPVVRLFGPTSVKGG